jgi:D-3-phosphoglycerate dehydrogenase
VPDYCVEEVADHALALVLALLRGVVVLDREVRAGGWDWRAAGELRRIRGTRLGVVGLGRTGRELARKAAALGFEVWGADPALTDEEIAAAGAFPAPLPELLAACHAVSLHVALTPETEGLLGPEELALMPDGAVLVDTARPQLVDLEALRLELESGRLGGAALDVIPVEPPTAAHPAPAWPRLIVTPHVAWYSAEADEACHTRPVLSVLDVLEGREPADAVNRP